MLSQIGDRSVQLYIWNWVLSSGLSAFVRLGLAAVAAYAAAEYPFWDKLLEISEMAPFSRSQPERKVEIHDEIFGPMELAAFLGVSKNTIWKLKREDPTFPPGKKIGRQRTRWTKSSVLEWMAQR